jgi:hypothetical protein
MTGHKLIARQPEHLPENASFDYDNLLPSIQKQVREETDVIRCLLAKTAANIVQIGLRLQLVRNRVGRDHFAAWLQAEFRWSRSVASNYMRAAKVFGDIDCLDQFQPSALYVLAREKTPEPARKEALDRARQGEQITKSHAETLLAQHSRPQNGKTKRAKHKVRRYLENAIRDLSGTEVEEVRQELQNFAQELQQPAPT